MGNQEIKKEVGIQCLHCGKWQFPPNRNKMDNWDCGHCHSGWLSIAMLSNLVSHHYIDQIQKNRKAQTRSRPCPQCRSQMGIAQVSRGKLVLDLEICRPCHILWFESGRLMQLLRLEEADKLLVDNTVPPHVKNAPPRPPQEETPEESTTFVPWGTLNLFGACAALSALAPKFHGANQMHALFALLVAGSYVEKKLRLRRYLMLFVVCALSAKFVHALHGVFDSNLCADSAAFGVVACGVTLVPYRDLLFPDQRWKTSTTALFWGLLAVFGVVMIVLGWDFFHTAFSRAGHGMEGAYAHGTLLGGLNDYVNTPSFRAHLVAATTGLLWVFRGK